MKRIYIIIIACIALCMAGSEFTPCFAQSDTSKKEAKAKTKVYKQEMGKLTRRFLFGVAVSYSDSATIVTNISPVDGIDYDIKTNTPVGFDLYTTSLRNHLASQGKTGYICSTFLCKDMKEAEKKLIKIKEKAKKNKNTKVIPLGDFTYEYISTEHIFSNAGTSDNEDDF